ncbi:MAG: TlpA family protein disulfide reductase [Holophagales bacterium]|jgi:thiol-disulfide isomerase/thioredoxin|nr:TlpA family protein disulfide reductase [Holophagales bacterium]
MIIRAAAFALLASISLAAQAPKVKPTPAIEKEWIPIKEVELKKQKFSEHAALIGKPMPKLDLSGWVNGQLDSEDMKGKIVIIDFWTTWCGPCIAAIQHNIIEMAKKYADRGVLVLGVCGSGRGKEKMGDVVKAKGVTYPNARPTPATEKAWRVFWYPTYAVVDRDGIVRALGINLKDVEKVVDALLEEQPK